MPVDLIEIIYCTARQLLLNAGYRYQNGRLVDAKCQPVKFEFLIQQQDLQRTLMPFIRNLKRLGVSGKLFDK